MKTYVTVISLVLVTAFASFGQSASPAEKRARDIVQLFNGGSRPEYRKYAEANFGGRMALPMERYVNGFSSTVERSRGFEISGVQDASKPNEVTLLLRNKLTGEWEALFVAVEADAPNKIAGLGFRTPKPPAAGTRRLTAKEAGSELEAFMKKVASADVFSGTVLLAKDGVPIYQGAFGIANKDFDAPNRIDTKFNLGSMNKMFTAVAIAQLVEKGKLSFEDPLSKFIPDFPDKESAEKIRIKHLLTHTAGLGGYFSQKWAERSRQDIRTVDDMMALVKGDEKLQFQPGTKWQYSNTGMLVLGKVIEIVSGQSYYDYVRENISKPAGMTNTDCYELDKVNHNLAVGYDKQYTDTGVTFKNNVFMHVIRGGPQGGGYSTVEDLLKFDQALRGGKLVSLEMVKTLTTAKPELNSPNYGYGFQVGSAEGSFGHSGGFNGINSDLTMYPNGWSVIVMSNYSRADPVTQKMRRLVEAAGIK